MSTLADIFNTPTELPFRGKVYKLRAPTQEEQAIFQTWLETRARESAGRAVGLTESLQRQLIKDTNDAVAAGEYDWVSENAAKALRTPLGCGKLLSIICRDDGLDHETAVALVIEKLQEICALLNERAASDPKSVAAALTRLGLPSTNLSRNSSTRRSTSRSKKSRR